MENKKVVLYDLTLEIRALDDLLKMDEGEITKEFELLEKEVIESLSLKVDSYIGFTSMLEDEIQAAARRIKELNHFVSVRENSIERLKKYALMALEAAKVKKFTGQFGEISTRKPTKVLKINEIKYIPLEFIINKVTSTVDSKALKTYLTSGLNVDGCELVDGKKSVSFKIKSLKSKND